MGETSRVEALEYAGLDSPQTARQKLEYYLDEIASLHPNDYRRELDAVIAEAAPQITDVMVERGAKALGDNQRLMSVLIAKDHPNLLIMARKVIEAALHGGDDDATD